jgi:hypothetical protein
MCRAGGLRGVRTLLLPGSASTPTALDDIADVILTGQEEPSTSSTATVLAGGLTRPRILRRRSALSSLGLCRPRDRGSARERLSAGRAYRPAGDDRCPASAFGRIAPTHAARASTGTPILANGRLRVTGTFPWHSAPAALRPTPILWSRPRRPGARGRNPIGYLGPGADALGKTPSGLPR